MDGGHSRFVRVGARCDGPTPEFLVRGTLPAMGLMRQTGVGSVLNAVAGGISYGALWQVRVT